MSKEKQTILVATHNPGKVQEYKELLADLQLSWVGLRDVGIDWDVEETGKTFEENAILKASTYARTTDLPTLADDSGLVVDALDGKPGVYTARFGGEGLSSVERYQLLLTTMADVPMEQRTARFRCAVALVQGAQLLGTAEGTVEGKIALRPSGEGGFGYDPVFYLEEHGKTMAQLPAQLKNEISHRARALAGLRPTIRKLLSV